MQRIMTVPIYRDNNGRLFIGYDTPMNKDAREAIVRWQQNVVFIKEQQYKQAVSVLDLLEKE